MHKIKTKQPLKYHRTKEYSARLANVHRENLQLLFLKYSVQLTYWLLEDKHAFEEKLKFKGRSVSFLLSYVNLDKSLCRP